jgi:hypothetical protein
MTHPRRCPSQGLFEKAEGMLQVEAPHISSRGSRRLSPRGSRSTSTNTSVPTTMGKGPRLPRLSCARTFGCKFVQARTRTAP